MHWDQDDTPLLAAALTDAFNALPQMVQTDENAGAMRYVIRTAIADGNRDEKSLIAIGLKLIR